MERNELKELIEKAVEKAISNPSIHCRYTIAPELHQTQHEALQRFIKMMDSIDNIRWAVAKAVVLLLVLALLSFSGWGIFHRIENLLGR